MSLWSLALNLSMQAPWILPSSFHFFVGSFAKYGVIYVGSSHTSTRDIPCIRVRLYTRGFRGSSCEYMDRAEVTGVMETHWGTLIFQREREFSLLSLGSRIGCASQKTDSRREKLSQMDLLLTPRTLCLSWTPSLTLITLLSLHSRCLSLTALCINCLIYIQFPGARDFRSSRHLKGIVSTCDGYKHHPCLMRSGDGIQIWYLSICRWIFGLPRNLSITYTHLFAPWLSRLWLFCMQRTIPKSWHRVGMSQLSLVWQLAALWGCMFPGAGGREGDRMCASVIHWGFALGGVTRAARSWVGW